MAQPGALTSDHINYLIFRYLQESGHESTARVFYRDWNRPHDYRDPEDLPFAQTVSRYELVSVIQDGLAHDELQARIGRNERRFRWNLSTTAGNMEEGGENGSRPSSSGNKKGRLPQLGGMRAPDEFPTPPAKRQRLGHGPEAAHVNGDADAMDLDATSATPEDPEEDAEAASPEVASDDAVDALTERYDSLDVATQTEISRHPKTSTISFGISKPGANVKVYQSSWNPSNDPTMPSNLLVVGEDLCRYYHIPNLEHGDLQTIEHMDLPAIPANSTITASAWHPSGRFTTCAVETTREIDGRQVSAPKIMDVGRDVGTVVYPTSAPSLDPSNSTTVLCVKYSPSGNHVLVSRTNGKRSIVEIYETPEKEDRSMLRADAVAWRVFASQILDAVWTDDDCFVVCGDEGTTITYCLLKPGDLTNGNSIAVHHLMEQSLQVSPDHTRWDKISYDAASGILIFASKSEKKLTAYLGPNSASNEIFKTVEMTTPYPITSLALQPQDKLNGVGSGPPKAILAVSLEEGGALLFSVSQSAGAIAFEKTASCVFEALPLDLSWSPNGKHLAIGGSNKVRVWRVDTEGAVPSQGRPLVEWELPSESDGSKSAEANGADEAHSEPSLSWSPDGERLGFAIDQQIAVISFRPPLSSNDEGHANGAMSP